jgi:hypothetical protein
MYLYIYNYYDPTYKGFLQLASSPNSGNLYVRSFVFKCSFPQINRPCQIGGWTSTFIFKNWLFSDESEPRPVWDHSPQFLQAGPKGFKR